MHTGTISASAQSLYCDNDRSCCSSLGRQIRKLGAKVIDIAPALCWLAYKVASLAALIGGIAAMILGNIPLGALLILGGLGGLTWTPSSNGYHFLSLRRI